MERTANNLHRRTGWNGYGRVVTSDDIAGLRHECAARVVALVDALRAIPEDLQPVLRAKTVAVREQIYFGWERPMAASRGITYIAGKYEVEGWWSVAAAELVNSGGFSPRTRQLEREHVEPMSLLVRELIAAPRTVDETAEFLDARLVTCTVLAAEHRALGVGHGWERYELAGIPIRNGLIAPEIGSTR